MGTLEWTLLTVGLGAVVAVLIARRRITISHEDVTTAIAAQLETTTSAFRNRRVEPTPEKGPFSLIDVDFGAPVFRVLGIRVDISTTSYYKIDLEGESGHALKYHAKIHSTFGWIRKVSIEEVI